MKKIAILLILVFSFGFVFSQNSGGEMSSLIQNKKNVSLNQSSAHPKSINGAMRGGLKIAEKANCGVMKKGK